MLESKFINKLTKLIIFINFISIIISIFSFIFKNNSLSVFAIALSIFTILADLFLYFYIKKIIIHHNLKKYGFEKNKIHKFILESTYIKSEDKELLENKIQINGFFYFSWKKKNLQINLFFFNEKNNKISKSTNIQLLERNTYDFREKNKKLIIYEYKNNGKGNNGYDHLGIAYFNLNKKEISYYNKYPKLSKGIIYFNKDNLN
ncbi:hypothetical protein X271_00379 [Candidatus Hepatoplasma crinochetorum Av]|uniref:Uncharacterized protein n=1 Tax=Candidatus Hepatoplasma crinochetorum Av TaxID=1427984 RepID=W8GSV1_9MOLU|nr:hypothetical protein [Candidatus Hepatoplasma crinochetorum]AHK22485.1 hypothetical protein X271_00379 [Candidatus Hepatoplasma crinochetorum Av]